MGCAQSARRSAQHPADQCGCGFQRKAAPGSSITWKLNAFPARITKERWNTLLVGNIIECTTCCLLHKLFWNTTSPCMQLSTKARSTLSFKLPSFPPFVITNKSITLSIALCIHYVAAYDVVMALKTAALCLRLPKVWKDGLERKLPSQRPSHVGWLVADYRVWRDALVMLGQLDCKHCGEGCAVNVVVSSFMKLKSHDRRNSHVTNAWRDVMYMKALPVLPSPQK